MSINIINFPTEVDIVGNADNGFEGWKQQITPTNTTITDVGDGYYAIYGVGGVAYVNSTTTNTMGAYGQNQIDFYDQTTSINTMDLGTTSLTFHDATTGNQTAVLDTSTTDGTVLIFNDTTNENETLILSRNGLGLFNPETTFPYLDLERTVLRFYDSTVNKKELLELHSNGTLLFKDPTTSNTRMGLLQSNLTFYDSGLPLSSTLTTGLLAFNDTSTSRYRMKLDSQNIFFANSTTNKVYVDMGYSGSLPYLYLYDVAETTTKMNLTNRKLEIVDYSTGTAVCALESDKLTILGTDGNAGNNVKIEPSVIHLYDSIGIDYVQIGQTSITINDNTTNTPYSTLNTNSLSFIDTSSRQIQMALNNQNLEFNDVSVGRTYTNLNTYNLEFFDTASGNNSALYTNTGMTVKDIANNNDLVILDKDNLNFSDSTTQQSLLTVSKTQVKIYDDAGSGTKLTQLDKTGLNFYDASGNVTSTLGDSSLLLKDGASGRTVMVLDTSLLEFINPADNHRLFIINTEYNSTGSVLTIYDQVENKPSTTLSSSSVVTPNVQTTSITDCYASTGYAGYSLTSMGSGTGIKWSGLTLQNVCDFGATTTNIQPTNITDTASSTGTVGQILTKDTGGILWRPNLPSLLIATATYNAPTSVSYANANNLVFTTPAVIVSTTTATYQITYVLNGQSAGNHTQFATVARSTVTPATSSAINLAKPNQDMTTSTNPLNVFGSYWSQGPGGALTSTNSCSFTYTPGTTGTFYFSLWVWVAQSTITSAYGNLNIILIKP